MIDLGADAEPLGERRRTDRHEHELLQVDRVVGVDAAVDHVQHRHRQGCGGLASELTPEWLSGIGCGRLRRCERDAEDRIRAQPAFVRRPVELDQLAVERLLVAGVRTQHGSGDLRVDVGDRIADPLASPGGTAVA